MRNNRTVFLIVTALSIITTRAFAQHGLDLGVGGGFNLATQQIPEGITKDNGGIGNLRLDYWFWDNSAIGLQASILHRGSALTNQGLNSPATSSSSSSTYLEIPITYKIRFGSGDFKPYAFAGPTMAAILRQDLTVTSKSGNGTLSTTTNPTPSEGLILGLLGGVGVSYDLTTRTSTFLEAAYQHGLTNNSLAGSARDLRISTGFMFHF